jgi:hypothetical protein
VRNVYEFAHTAAAHGDTVEALDFVRGSALRLEPTPRRREPASGGDVGRAPTWQGQVLRGAGPSAKWSNCFGAGGITAGLLYSRGNLITGEPLVPPWAPPYGRGRGFRRWRSRRLARHVHRSCVWCASRRGEPGSGGPSLSLSGVSFWGTSRFPLPPPFYPAAAKRQRTTSVLRRPSNFARRRVTANSTPDGVRREITCVRTSRDPKAT